MLDFLFITCQIGAERAVKEEMVRCWKDFRFAYSRPGFLTFKLPEKHRLADDFDLHSVFARAYAFSLGKVQGQDQAEMAREAWKLFGHRKVERIHVWPRDTAEPGEHGYEPRITSEAIEVHARLLEQCPRAKGDSPIFADHRCATVPAKIGTVPADPFQPARRGEHVFDCVLVEPDQWWIGFHRADQITTRWPGGMLALELPACAVSRAWLKMEEALRWSQLPIPSGAHIAEIGSAPGGASQALLGRGMIVTGIDPAEMHAEVLKDPHFTHLHRRSTQVPRREFRKIRWLTVDMNVAPNYTLDAVEAIVQHPQVSIRGMILTLKLPEWSIAAQVPDYIKRIKSWGYNIVHARQLQHNRREICVAALQKPFRR
ncbi:MAG: SAM-dependent methyltransferase [Thermoguttaceae bacterium]|jgi:23S rRNA (cytidine2498-2'-O)-methyltransferase